MVSFDIESLFTNIPLLQSIEIAVDYILTGNLNIKLSKDNLKELFLIATAQTHFLFQGNYYDQIDGVATGSPLALVLANLLMGHMKEFGSNNTMVLQFISTADMWMAPSAFSITKKMQQQSPFSRHNCLLQEFLHRPSHQLSQIYVFSL